MNSLDEQGQFPLMMSTPLFWVLVLYSALLLIAVSVAVVLGMWRMAVCVLIGAVLGMFLAVYPLWWAMKASEAATGSDAGNAGVFFVCTVLLLPPLGMLIGAAAGHALEGRSGRA